MTLRSVMTTPESVSVRPSLVYPRICPLGLTTCPVSVMSAQDLMTVVEIVSPVLVGANGYATHPIVSPSREISVTIRATSDTGSMALTRTDD
jgi:hypothetical protein